VRLRDHRQRKTKKHRQQSTIKPASSHPQHPIKFLPSQKITVRLVHRYVHFAAGYAIPRTFQPEPVSNKSRLKPTPRGKTGAGATHV
jgi:hypothetical protein